MSGTVRTRVAPSPTGDPHVGTAYVALVNFCFAKKNAGDFVLRIEDTDQQRSTQYSEQAILKSLRWLGLSWNEGPDVGGAYGPYRQSDRTELYREHVAQLLEQGNAFRCFCTPQRLEEMRQTQRTRKVPSRYDGRCLHLAQDDAQAAMERGESFVVRMKVPDEGTCVVDDMLRGLISIQWNSVDMQILLKSDGMPTYHLANVVDDHLMKITHVIRGEEWVSSAPKHMLLYRYFDWIPPAFCHLPLLRNADKSKLSKRKNPTGIFFFRAMGYLPEALLNFLGLFTVSSTSEDEKMSAQNLLERFDLSHISLGGPVFDVAKLDWLNGRYIRESLDTASFMQHVREWNFSEGRLQRIAELARPRIDRLSDLGQLTAFLFSGHLPLRADQLRATKLDDATLRRSLGFAMWDFDVLAQWDQAGIESVLKSVAERNNKKLRDVVRIFYIAITGSTTSLPLFDAMELLGRDLCRERLRYALALLGGVTSSEEKEWREWA
ncbi:MAG: glutamate--tRNA ligase [Candidatus Eremiobacteraeota bacterium]|nr:glutamate--tRNA ligase [Candidatus Eremiobacteraeota bacterium]